jgi:uncharacterized protein
MRRVFVDSSVLIHLSAIGRLHLLQDLFGTVTVPPAVWREVVVQGKGRPGVGDLVTAHREHWLEVLPPAESPLLRTIRWELDEGEAEVLALATEHPGSLALLDESEGRRVAAMLGVEKTGAIGILIRAKLESRIESLRTELDRMRTEAGFWIEESLYRRALEISGE